MTRLNKKEISDLLPHRDPMLLIDELYDIEKLFSATAVVNVKKDSFFVQGHFPGNPVMPGATVTQGRGGKGPRTRVPGKGPKVTGGLPKGAPKG